MQPRDLSEHAYFERINLAIFRRKIIRPRSKIILMACHWFIIDATQFNNVL